MGKLQHGNQLIPRRGKEENEVSLQYKAEMYVCDCINKLCHGERTYREAEILAEPLAWYIETGRAPTPFLQKLVGIRPFLIVRRLEKGGSTNEVVERIKEFVNNY